MFVIPKANVIHFAMAAYEQFTQYDVELEVPEQAVQELDESVRKGTHRSRTLEPEQDESTNPYHYTCSPSCERYLQIHDSAWAQLLGPNSSYKYPAGRRLYDSLLHEGKRHSYLPG